MSNNNSRELPDEPGVWVRGDDWWSVRSFEGRLYGRMLYFNNVPSTHDTGQTKYINDMPKSNWHRSLPSPALAALQEELSEAKCCLAKQARQIAEVDELKKQVVVLLEEQNRYGGQYERSYAHLLKAAPGLATLLLDELAAVVTQQNADLTAEVERRRSEYTEVTGMNRRQAVRIEELQSMLTTARQRIAELEKGRAAWKKRALYLDASLCWIRVELHGVSHLGLSQRWAKEAYAMIEEKDEDFRAFLDSVDDYDEPAKVIEAQAEKGA